MLPLMCVNSNTGFSLGWQYVYCVVTTTTWTIIVCETLFCVCLPHCSRPCRVSLSMCALCILQLGDQCQIKPQLFAAPFMTEHRITSQAGHSAPWTVHSVAISRTCFRREGKRIKNLSAYVSVCATDVSDSCFTFLLRLSSMHQQELPESSKVMN